MGNLWLFVVGIDYVLLKCIDVYFNVVYVKNSGGLGLGVMGLNDIGYVGMILMGGN